MIILLNKVDYLSIKKNNQKLFLINNIKISLSCFFINKLFIKYLNF